MRLFRKKSPKRLQGRIGIIQLEAVRAGLFKEDEEILIQFRVEELEQVSGMSRVHILNVSGVDNSLKRMAAEQLPEYILSSNIRWIKEAERETDVQSEDDHS